MTKLNPKIVEEAIHLLEAGELATREGMKVPYSCYALATAQGYAYDNPSFDERNNVYLKAYNRFSFDRFGAAGGNDLLMPTWWNSAAWHYVFQRSENLRLFKAAIEEGDIR